MSPEGKARTMRREIRREIFDLPHLRSGEVRSQDVPAGRGLQGYRQFWVKTACGLERQPTSCTRDPERVRCPHCLATMRLEGVPRSEP